MKHLKLYEEYQEITKDTIVDYMVNHTIGKTREIIEDDYGDIIDENEYRDDVDDIVSGALDYLEPEPLFEVVKKHIQDYDGAIMTEVFMNQVILEAYYRTRDVFFSNLDQDHPLMKYIKGLELSGVFDIIATQNYTVHIEVDDHNNAKQDIILNIFNKDDFYDLFIQIGSLIQKW